jgi:hypothetical protein
LPRSVDHGVAVAVEPGIVEVGMGINEHAIPESKDLKGDGEEPVRRPLSDGF